MAASQEKIKALSAKIQLGQARIAALNRELVELPACEGPCNKDCRRCALAAERNHKEAGLCRRRARVVKMVRKLGRRQAEMSAQGIRTQSAAMGRDMAC